MLRVVVSCGLVDQEWTKDQSGAKTLNPNAHTGFVAGGRIMANLG